MSPERSEKIYQKYLRELKVKLPQPVFKVGELVRVNTHEYDYACGAWGIVTAVYTIRSNSYTDVYMPDLASTKCVFSRDLEVLESNQGAEE